MTATPLELEGHREVRHRERAIRRRIYSPPPRMTVSEWADRYRRLSRVSSASEGRWHTDRAPFLREIMDAWTDPLIERIVFKKPAQCGGTEVLNNCLGHIIHLNPWPVILAQPTVDLAKMWSKERLDPMLRDTPVLKGVMTPEGNRREKGQEIQRKMFRGGYVAMVGANSAAGLRARPAPYLLCDEIDAWPASARGASKGQHVGEAGEGDPLTLLRARQTTFWNRKEIDVSTPTLQGFSRIDREYEASDQRTFWVPCPHCGLAQRLFWRNLIWEPGKPETAAYRCGEVDEKTGEVKAGCAARIPELHKTDMLRRGKWIPARSRGKVAGFWINALYSPFITWAEIVEKFLSAKGKPEEMQGFVNTVLAETWAGEGDAVDAGALEARREVYPAEVPEGVRILTMGVDVQGDRLEATIWGWGPNEAPWQIRHETLWGSPEAKEVWTQLDLVRRRAWRRADGQVLRIRATAVDSGGHHTDEVYRYCKARAKQQVHCIKGSSEPGQAAIAPPGKRSKVKVRLWMLGTEAIKDTLFARLRLDPGHPEAPHFPMPTTAEYFRQLTSEVRHIHYRRGRPVPVYERKPGYRGEALDCWVYAYAALLILGPVREALRQWRPAKEPVVTPPAEPEPPPPTPAQVKVNERAQQLIRKKRSFVQGWRR